jgi:hypothetical protein
MIFMNRLLIGRWLLMAVGGGDRKRDQRLTLVILLIAGLVRIPFLWRGFGGHPDEWYLIRSGLDFWLHGTYHPSRPVGYPLNEIMMAGLAWLGGAPACAIAATAASLAALVYMRCLAPYHGIADSFWLVLAFSFEPWFWSSGTHDLDYVWCLLSLLAAFYYVERRRLGVAGFACGLGFGFRPTSLLWIAPLFVRVVLVERRWRGVIRFGLSAAVSAVIPAWMILWWLIAAKSEAFYGIGWQFAAVTQAARSPEAAPALALYHLVELIGHIPALLLIAACYVNRHQLLALFRSREGWVWTYILIFTFLLLPFLSLSEKPEHMLPALPGLFMILGRCISNNWWKGLTTAFVFSAFVSFGFGYVGHAGGLSVELTTPSLRPGVLLWYAKRAQASNDSVLQTGSKLSQHSRIIRADSPNLDDLYVSALLKRGPASQARISCPLIPALVSSREDEPVEIRLSKGLPPPSPSYYSVLVCCNSISAVVSSYLPRWQENQLSGKIERLCASRK